MLVGKALPEAASNREWQKKSIEFCLEPVWDVCHGFANNIGRFLLLKNSICVCSHAATIKCPFSEMVFPLISCVAFPCVFFYCPRCKFNKYPTFYGKFIASCDFDIKTHSTVLQYLMKSALTIVLDATVFSRSHTKDKKKTEHSKCLLRGLYWSSNIISAI